MPSPRVLDLDRQAGRHVLRPQQRGSVRRGELGGVLHQLGDEVDNVGDRGAAEHALHRGARP